MKTHLLSLKPYSVIFAIFVLFIIGTYNAYSQSSENWYKGNLHTHSYWSDGDEFPEMIMKWYKDKGYHFVALSDHNTLAEGTKWKSISKKALYQKAFKTYLNTFDDLSSIEHKKERDTLWVKLKTFEEYKPLFEEKEKFLILPSEEITDSFKNKPYHLNATNVQKLIQPQGGSGVVELLQNNIDAVHQQRDDTGVPMIVQINHPNFGSAIKPDDMKQLTGNRFFEIFNGHPHVNNDGDEHHTSTEEMWDILNIAYLKDNKPLLYGIASDDSHHYHNIGKKWSNAGIGWIQVKAVNLDNASIIKSMERGKFYGSTGIEMEQVAFKNNVLQLKIKASPNTNYKIQFIGCYKGDKSTSILKTIKGTEASFELKETILFVRAKITSDSKTTRENVEMEYKTAWIQPVVFQ